MEDFSSYTFGGVRALVQLHEQHLREFLEVWRQAKAAGVTLPETEDDNYASLATLLKHVLGAAGWYMETMCECLDLPDPSIDPVPAIDEVETRAGEYLEHVLTRWRLPLVDITEEQAYTPIRTTPSGAKLNLDAMLEHAVMHPIRHEFQLRALLEAQP